MKAVRIVQLVAGALALAAGPQAMAGGKADRVYVNGSVYTPQGWREAVAVDGERILATGTNAQIARLRGPKTVVIDLKGKTVLPGLYDMHVHPAMAGNGSEGSCRVEQGVSADAFLAGVKACVDAAKPGQWVAGGQWQAISMGDTPITAATLDAISPNNPVMLFDISGHSLWANSLALKAAGIARGTPDPEGGVIERDADGVPTGVLRETARSLVFAHVPPPTPEQDVAGLRGGTELLLSYGIVGFVDAMVVRSDLVAYRSLDKAGGLKQRVQACIAYSHAGAVQADFEAVLAERKAFESARLRTDCVKIFADGVPTESHTAAMLAPYTDDRPGVPPLGMLLFDPKVVNPLVARLDRMGVTVLFHAAGDAAVRAGFDAVEYARRQNGMGGPHHQIGHSTFIAKEDLPRNKALDAAIELSPYLWYPSPINDDIIKAIGPERIARVWPIREAIEAGGIVVAGSDWAVVPQPDVWLAIQTAVTRAAPGGTATYGPGEAITLPQAVDMFSIQAARRLGRERDQGSIEAGKLADFIVLDRNPFKLPATEIHMVKVEQTWIGGEKVFERK